MEEIDSINIPLPEDLKKPEICTNDLSATPVNAVCDSNSPGTLTKSVTNSPNTDNLLTLNINPIKTPLLGTLQAKKRLLAFCQSKQPIPPRIKKNKKLAATQSNNVLADETAKSDEATKDEGKARTEDKLPTKKSKKGLKSGDKAKAVIEEIELIKKAESAYIEAIGQGLLNNQKTKRSKSRSRSRDRSYKRSKRRSSDHSHSKRNSTEHIKYPTTWKEVIKNNYDFDKLKQIRSQMSGSKQNDCNDYRKQLLFETPSVPLNPLKYRGVNGEEKTVEIHLVRYTRKYPSVSYSENSKEDHPVFTRDQIFSFVPKSFKCTLQKFANNRDVSLNLSNFPRTKSKSRNWYPKNFNWTNCEVLETSASLSILKNYSDAEEYVEETELIKQVTNEHENDEQDKESYYEQTSPKKIKSDNNNTKKLKKDAKEDEFNEEVVKKTKKKHKDKKYKVKGKKVKTKKDKAKGEKIKKKKKRKKLELEEKDNVEKGDLNQNESEIKDVKSNETEKPPRLSNESSNSERNNKKTKSETKNKKRKETTTDNSKTESDSKRSKSKEKSRVPKKDIDVPKRGLSKDKTSHHRHSRSKSKEQTKIADDEYSTTPKSELTFYIKPEKEKTPDTDEYHSHWESDEDVGHEKASKHNRSWESDEDMFERSIPKFIKTEPLKTPEMTLERSLEMPLNISKSFKRDVLQINLPQVKNHVIEKSVPKNFDILPLKDNEKECGKSDVLEAIKKFCENKVSCNNSDKDVVKEDKILDESTVLTDEKKRKRKKCRWDIDDADASAQSNLISSAVVSQNSFDLIKIKVESTEESNEKSDTPLQPTVLENEYEEFMKALTSDTSKDEDSTIEVKRKNKRKNKSSSSSSSDTDSSSDSSTSSSSSDSSSSEDKKRKKRKKKMSVVSLDKMAKSDLDLDILPKDVSLTIGFTDVPLPVPSPGDKVIPLIPLQIPVGLTSAVSSTLIDETNMLLEFDRTKPLNLSSLSLPDKKILNKSALENIDSDDSAERIRDSEDNYRRSKEADVNCSQRKDDLSPNRSISKQHGLSPKRGDTSRDVSPHDHLKRRDSSPRRSKKHDTSPKRHDSFRKHDSSQKRAQKTPRRRESPLRRRDLSPKRRDVSPRRRSSPKRRDGSPKKRNASPKRRESPSRRELSPRRRDGSPKRRDGSPKRRDLSPKRRDGSPKRRDLSPKRSPRRYDSSGRMHDLLSPRRGYDLSPRHGSPRRYSSSPRRNNSPSRRHSSPRRDLKRRRSPSPRYRNLSPRGLDISPRRYNISPKRSLSPRRDSSMKRRLSPNGGEPKKMHHADYGRSSKSPINSPLDGFKRSVADSTISDDLLSQHNVNDYLDSPIYRSQYYHGTVMQSSSPKRIPLDDRINQVLGIEKELPKPIGTTYDQANYNPQYYQQYEQYNYLHSDTSMYEEYKYISRPPQQGLVNKVVQVGNVLHVMPAEDIQPPAANVQVVQSVPKIVQVGNVLEIVPTATIEIVPPPKEITSAEALMKQKNAERRAEHEKRRQERELRRKEKEKKKRERERRKQTKIKLKTENMIKRALLLESTGEEVENQEGDETTTVQWPPVPIVITNATLKPAGKGILITHGFSDNKIEGAEAAKKKSVKFADGVNPGEGTSPSGGEELSSPPPLKTLPKEKRYKKTKLSKKVKPKKKKIKVKIIRKIHDYEGDDSEEDNFPPPSPPPGSPPPHIFPPRLKTHTINNVHLNYVNTVINTSLPPPPPPSAIQNTNVNYHPPYRPMPVVMAAPLPRGSTSAQHLQAPHGHMHPQTMHSPSVLPAPHRLPGPHRV